MSARKVLPILAILLIAGLLAAGCAKPEEAAPTPPSPAATKPSPMPSAAKPTVGEPTKAPEIPKDKIVYFNPKDPKEVSDKPGKSKAGEELVAGTYQCPMHADQMSNKPGECPICKMPLKLVPVEEAQSKLAEEQGKGETNGAEHTH